MFFFVGFSVFLSFLVTKKEGGKRATGRGESGRCGTRGFLFSVKDEGKKNWKKRSSFFIMSRVVLPCSCLSLKKKCADFITKCVCY